MIGRSPVFLVEGLPRTVEDLPFRAEQVRDWGKPIDPDCPSVNGLPAPPQPGERQARQVMMEISDLLTSTTSTDENDMSTATASGPSSRFRSPTTTSTA